jgi:cytochrome b561
MDGQRSLNNTESTYGLVAICFHWLVAAAFIVNYGLVYYRNLFLVPRSVPAREVMSYHTAIGVSVFVFVVLRVVWKCLQQQPKPVAGSKLQQGTARAAHLLLYGAMVVMPLSGYLGHGRPSQFFFFIEMPRFADTWLFKTVVEGWMKLTWKQFEAPVDFIHQQGGTYVVAVLLCVHIGAALYHHFVRKDDILKRMWPAAGTA